MSTKKAITMAKIPENSEILKKESYLLKTPTKTRSFRKEVRTSLGRSIKKLKRAFFSEPPNLRWKSRRDVSPKKLGRKSRRGVYPKKLDMCKGAPEGAPESEGAETAVGVKPPSFAEDDSVVLDDNNFGEQNTGSDSEIEFKSLTLKDAAMALSALLFIVGVFSALMYMTLNIDLSICPFLRQHARRTYNDWLDKLDLQGLKVAFGIHTDALVGYLTKVLRTIRESIFS